MRNICIFCETWASGGIESFLTNILSRMDFSEIRVDIIAIRLEDSVFTKRLAALGIRFYELAKYRWRLAANRKRLLELFAEEGYDAIHVNAFHGGALYYVHLARIAGIPLRIAHSHNAGLRSSRGLWLKQLIHKGAICLFAEEATDFWACSAAAAKFLFCAGKRDLPAYRLIPNGIDIRRFRFNQEQRDRMRDRLGVSNRIVVGHVGRLCSQKNQLFLLSVFAVFQGICPDSTLLLVGDGEERRALERKAEGLHIAEKTIFCNTLEHVEWLLWSMDLFAFPSRFEGLGIAMVEAQAAGLPVLCSDQVPEEAFILPSVSSLSLDAGPEKWANALAGCRGRVTNREVCAGLVWRRGFDADEIAKHIEAVYLDKV